MPFSTTKAEMPCFARPFGSVTAKTTQTSPYVPWVVKVLAPFSTQLAVHLHGAGAGAGGVASRRRAR